MTLLLMGKGLLLVALASLIIARACDGFEAAADYLGRNMTEGMKGATINAIGSSMPELCVTFIYLFLYRDTTGFAGGIGTTAGSAVFNAMIIPALVIFSVLFVAAETKIQVARSVVIRDGLTLLCAEAFLIFFLGQTLEWFHGFFLMLLYMSYAAWMVYRNKENGADSDENDNQADEEEADHGEKKGSRLLALLTLDLQYALTENKPLAKPDALTLLAVATAVIAIACWLLVASCEMVGHALGLHGYFVAVILAAAASSVPDTILSIKDARKGNYDDALANALGSNIFDICFALGAPLFLYTIIYGPIQVLPETTEHIVELRILLLILTLLTFFIFLGSKYMTKKTGWMLIGLYAIFVTYVAGRAYDLAFFNTIADYIHMVQAFIN